MPETATDTAGAGDDLLAALVVADVGRGDALALTVATGVGLGVATASRRWSVATHHPATVVERIEAELRPRWIWWSNETAATLVAAGVRVAKCWDLAAVHRLLFGGWRSEPARVWAALHDLASASIPAMGQLDLLGSPNDEGTDGEEPVRPDLHLRPEWASGGWACTPERLARWAATAMQAAGLQRDRGFEPVAGPVAGPTAGPAAGRPDPQRLEATARSESVAELLCAELSCDGLPIDLERAEEIIGSFLGPRPSNEHEAIVARRQRDDLVQRLPGVGTGTDLRNPAHVRSMLSRVGVEVPDTRAWRLEEFRDTNPVVDALLTWRKAERIETTFGYSWLDLHVREGSGRRGRLHGAWSGSDGAAGRMTAQAGLHNMPADLRSAVAAEPGHVFVRADLGQIEPRVLAAVSGDRLLAAATADDDMYAPVAARLGVQRSVAKVAVLAAMYGQTSGAAGQALRGMESLYPVAMQYLRTADETGRAGGDVFTYGGRRIRMWQIGDDAAAVPAAERAAAAARGRFARNAVVQGAAAELFKTWAVTVRARSVSIGARIVLCLHDELLVHVPAEHGPAAARLLDECLQEAAWRWSHSDSGQAPAAAARAAQATVPEAGTVTAVAGTVRFVAETSIIARWSDAKA